MSGQNLFRKEALDQLASPERLDQLIQVTSPKAWLALAGLAALMLVFVGWGVVGRINTRVHGQGILLGGDVYEVVPLWPGRVKAIHVGLGDEVVAGDLVAELEQPELAQQIENAKARLRELQDEDEYIVATSTRESETQRGYYAELRTNLQQNIEEYEELLRLATARLEGRRQLLDRGLITAEQLIPVQEAYSASRAQLANARAELTQVRLDELGAEFAVPQRITTSEQEVHEAERVVTRLENDYMLRSNVRCTSSGRVLELTVDEGSVIESGQALMRISLSERAAGQLRAVLYVGGEDGKRVEPGMSVLVGPTTVRPEEYGYMLGRVTRIADFPATSEGMQRVLKNDQLVRQLSLLGSPFQLDVELIRDTTATSGYAWTSGHGPTVAIADGTPILGRVIVETRRPVQLVIPGLKKLFALY